MMKATANPPLDIVALPPVPVKSPGTPVGDCILILPDAPVQKTAEGIALPEAAIKRPKTGRVLAIGPRVPPEITVGAHVAWLYDIPTDSMLFGRFLVLNPDDIAVILSE